MVGAPVIKKLIECTSLNYVQRCPNLIVVGYFSHLEINILNPLNAFALLKEQQISQMLHFNFIVQYRHLEYLLFILQGLHACS